MAAPQRLIGKVAFVTGAARGQGRAHAVRLAQEGADLIICDLCAELGTTSYPGSVPNELTETVELIEKEGRRVVARQADVRDAAALQSLVDDGVAELGHLDIVVANAGIDSANLSWEISEEQWDELVGINLKGVWLTTKVAIPTMIRQGTGGSIILTSSTAGRKGLPFKAHYTAAKHGVLGLGRVLAAELGEYDIRVNTLHPAGVATAMVTDPHLQELIVSKADTLGPIFMNSLPHMFMQPEDIANAVAYLASDDSKYMTGSEFVVDMGNTAR
jgi:SDR family mycofactocin-dependent oxidoreductase